MNSSEMGIRVDREKLDPVLEKAHDKALEYIRTKSINPDHFRGVSTGENEQITEDQQKAAEIKSQFPPEKREQKIARIFEALACDMSSSYFLPEDKYKMPQPGWFGYRGLALKTCEYDDFLHHTDLVLDFDGGPKDPRSVQIAVDLTFGASDENLKKKLLTTQNEVASGNGRQLRYFESEKSGKKRNLSHLPSAVVGIGYPRITELARLWISGSASDQKALRASPVRKIIATELVDQLGRHYANLENIIREDPESFHQFGELRDQYKLALTFAKGFFTHVSGAEYRGGEDEDLVFKKIMAAKIGSAEEAA